MYPNQELNDQIIKEILAGKYRNCFLIYNRKSTDEPDNQKNSIKYQRAENLRFAQRERLSVAQISLEGFCRDGMISERHSAFKDKGGIVITTSGLVQYEIERPKFQQLIKFLSKRLFKGVIVLCWDRISRNRGDDTIVRKLMKMGIEVHFAFAKYDSTSSGALHMDIDGMFSEHYSRVVSEKITLAVASLRDQGICTTKAPLGYLNIGTTKDKPIDPVRGPIVKRLFELLVEKHWSLSDLTKWATEQGLTTTPRRRGRTEAEKLAEEEDDVRIEIEPVCRPIRKNLLHGILTNRFYAGETPNSKGKWIPSQSHKALVSTKLFDEAQQVLRSKRVSLQYIQKPGLPGRAFVRCADCKRVYTPYIQKGIHYLYCRCPAGCPNPKKSLSAKFLSEEIRRHLNELSFTKAQLAKIESLVQDSGSTFEMERQKQMDQNIRRRKKISEDLAYLRENKISLLKTGVYSPESLRDDENRLEVELNLLEQAVQETSVSPMEIVKKAKQLSELLKYGLNYYNFANLAEKFAISSIIFSELFFSGKSLISQCKRGFQVFGNDFTSYGGGNTWLSEAIKNDNLISASIAELEEFFKARERAP